MNATALSVIHPHTSIGRVVAVVLGLWFIAASYASLNNIPAQTPWAMPVLVAMPLLLFGITWLSTPAFRNWALQLDQRFLILLHSWRMLGLGFVMLYFYDVLPAQFALPAGLGDATAAAWALLLGVALYRGSEVKPSSIHAWNTFGVIDFMAAVSLGLASRAAPLGLIQDGINTDPMGWFPLSIVPLFGVPFFLITHFIIYAQLRNRS